MLRGRISKIDEADAILREDFRWLPRDIRRIVEAHFSAAHEATKHGEVDIGYRLYNLSICLKGIARARYGSMIQDFNVSMKHLETIVCDICHRFTAQTQIISRTKYQV